MLRDTKINISIAVKDGDQWQTLASIWKSLSQTLK